MKKTFALGATALALSGCASIFQGSTQPLTITSIPEAASVTVMNRAGDKIHTGVTPVTLTVKRGAGYFKPESYRVVMQKEGYASREIVVTGGVNGWYFGNLIFGGLIGMVAVDPATGAMYSFPENVSGTLVQDPAAAPAAAAPAVAAPAAAAPAPAPAVTTPAAAAPAAASGTTQASNTLTIVSTDSLSAEVMKHARLLTAAK